MSRTYLLSQAIPWPLLLNTVPRHLCRQSQVNQHLKQYKYCKCKQITLTSAYCAENVHRTNQKRHRPICHRAQILCGVESCSCLSQTLQWFLFVDNIGSYPVQQPRVFGCEHMNFVIRASGNRCCHFQTGLYPQQSTRAELNALQPLQKPRQRRSES